MSTDVPDGAGSTERREPTGRLRVLQVTHDLGIGGLPKVVATLCSALDKSRFELSVLCLNAKGPLAAEIEERGVPVHCIGKPDGSPDYLAALKVARLLQRLGVDVVHTHNTQPFIEGGIGALIARVPTHIHTDHGRCFPDRRRYMWAERFLSRFTYRVVGVSEETCRQLAEWEGIDRRKLLTIPNGIDPAPFDQPVEPECVRSELGVAADAPLIGVVARLSPEKGVDLAIQAMVRIAATKPDATLAIVGYGPQEAALRALAGRLGVDDRVRFLGARGDVPRLVATFDCSLLPSRREGLPMFLLEAMAGRCPIVASCVGGIPTAVEEGRHGLLVEPRDPQALAAATLRLLDDSELRRRLATHARKRFEERYSAAAMARRYEALYLRGEVGA